MKAYKNAPPIPLTAFSKFALQCGHHLTIRFVRRLPTTSGSNFRNPDLATVKNSASTSENLTVLTLFFNSPQTYHQHCLLTPSLKIISKMNKSILRKDSLSLITYVPHFRPMLIYVCAYLCF